MKNMIFAVAMAATIFIACNSNNNKTAENKSMDDLTKVDSSKVKSASTTVITSKEDGAVREIVVQYLQIKNALANDNGKDAANAGNDFVTSMGKMDKSSLHADKKKIWENLADDAKEMAEHIGKNADKIEHQREHFDMLSNDMYDMVKAFGVGQTLYQDHCPMYNNKKGANWLSETKEIKNPYLGKKMPVCGSVKEEIK